MVVVYDLTCVNYQRVGYPFVESITHHSLLKGFDEASDDKKRSTDVRNALLQKSI